MLLSHGADLPWLTGYEAMPLERPTFLVLPQDADATLVVPALEAPRVVPDEAVFSVRPWGETEDPLRMVADLVGARRTLAISDRAWASSLLGLQSLLSRATWRPASSVTSPLRSVKDPEEVEGLAAAARAADRVARSLVCGEIALVGRTESDISDEIGARLRAEGHSRVNFAIVASGPNSASPHHEPGQRPVGEGDVVVCDFGGALVGDDGLGYCSDITRTVAVGEPNPQVREVYDVLEGAQSAAVRGAAVGRSYEEVDAIARDRISEAGYGPCFMHRTGHGIGLEAHEDPYLVAGNREPIVAGNAFSVEPGIYLAGRFGARIEDIVVATAEGPQPLNKVDHSLAVVEG